MIDKLANDGSHSKFLAGHISKAILDNQFLVDCDKVVESELAINCQEHNRPAVFYS